MGTSGLLHLNPPTASREAYVIVVNNTGHVFATDCINRLSCCITLRPVYWCPVELHNNYVHADVTYVGQYRPQLALFSHHLMYANLKDKLT
jgi:hypothetical protein